MAEDRLHVNKFRSADFAGLLAVLLYVDCDSANSHLDLAAAISDYCGDEPSRLLDADTPFDLAAIPEFEHRDDAIDILLALQELFIRIGVDAALNRAIQ